MRQIALTLVAAVGQQFATLVVKVFQLHARILLMLRQVEVRAMRHALKFTKAGRVNGKRYSTSEVPAPSFA